jgi:hypothetical protein
MPHASIDTEAGAMSPFRKKSEVSRTDHLIIIFVHSNTKTLHMIPITTVHSEYTVVR